MIVGNGMLARAFARYADDGRVVVFASGVSNSGESDDAAFARERGLLDATAAAYPRARIVYFSSCGVAAAGNDTPYMDHKRAMESRVLSLPDALVVRLPQVVGHTHNPHTLSNYLCNQIIEGNEFVVWSRSERNLVDIDHIVAITSELLETHEGSERVPVSIAALRSTPMPEIVAAFERVLRRRAHYRVEERGTPFPIDTTIAAEMAMRLGIDLGPRTTERTLRKYYGHLSAP